MPALFDQTEKMHGSSGAEGTRKDEKEKKKDSPTHLSLIVLE